MGMGLLPDSVVDSGVISFCLHVALRQMSHFAVSEKSVDTSRFVYCLLGALRFERNNQSSVCQNAGGGGFQRGHSF